MENKILFRASGVGHLYSSREPKDGGLSKTAKTFVSDMWRQNEYGYRPLIDSKYLTKGIEQEETSINLFSEVTGNFYIKNEERKSNRVLTGECDLYNYDTVIDIKTSWDLKTFMNGELTPLYEWQLRCYMELWDKPNAILAYCLVDAPYDLIMSEQQRLFFKNNNLDSEFEQNEMLLRNYESDCAQIKRNLVISDRISPKDRVKTFRIERDSDKMDYLYGKIEKAIEFYKTLNI